MNSVTKINAEAHLSSNCPPSMTEFWHSRVQPSYTGLSVYVAQTFWPFWGISGEIFETICQSGFEPWCYCDAESSLCAKKSLKYLRAHSLSPSDSITGKWLVSSMVCLVNEVDEVYQN